jgi:hypothetical protein
MVRLMTAAGVMRQAEDLRRHPRELIIRGALRACGLQLVCAVHEKQAAVHGAVPESQRLGVLR